MPIHDDWYIITSEGEVRKAESLEEWLRFSMDFSNKVVWKTPFDGGEVSTVFLGLDHGCYKDSEPILYETLIFAADDSPYAEWADTQAKYTTREGAIHGHEVLLRRMGLEEDPPGFEHPPVELQLSRIRLLMGDEG